MKRKILKTLCLLTALAMLAAVLPLAVLARTEMRHPTPEGYNDNDYQKVAAFLETTDEDGVSNVEKLRAYYYYCDFDLSDPSTWGAIIDPYSQRYVGFAWTEGEDGVKRLYGIEIEFELDEGYDITCPVGDLDLSDCTALENVMIMNLDLDAVSFSGCTALTSIWCEDVQQIDLTGCTELTFISCDASGTEEIDISDCSKLEHLQLCGSMTRLDLSNCPHLNWLNVGGTSIRTLDVTACPELTILLCGWSGLEELNAAGLAALHHLDARQSPLSILDITGCTALDEFFCNDTLLTDLDTSTCPELYFDHIRAEGGGYIGSSGGGAYGWMIAKAKPRTGSDFLGWYSESGELIGTELDLAENQTSEVSVVARFTEAQFVPGDVDCNGTVTVSDAIMALRASMGLLELTNDQFTAADMDGSNTVTVSDAILILRTAMGLV